MENSEKEKEQKTFIVTTEEYLILCISVGLFSNLYHEDAKISFKDPSLRDRIMNITDRITGCDNIHSVTEKLLLQSDVDILLLADFLPSHPSNLN